MSNMFASNKPRRNETLAQLILLLAVVAAFAQGFDLAAGSGDLARLALKGAAVTFLAFFAIVSARTRSHLVLTFGLGFAALGDIMLETGTEHSFISGLGAFLVFQLIFTGMYFANREEPHLISKRRYFTVLLLWAGGLAGVVLLWPLLGNMLTPVLAYTIALLTMASMAIFSRFHMLSVGLGAVLFVISDGLLAFRHFGAAAEAAGPLMSLPDWSGQLVWGLYFTGQLLMAAGVIFARDKPAFIRGYRL